MRDVLMLVSIALFFGLCIAYVSWCDRIIGPDPVDVRDHVMTDVDAAPPAASDVPM